MVQFVSYLRRVLCKTRLIFPRINGPNDTDGYQDYECDDEDDDNDDKGKFQIRLVLVLVVMIMVKKVTDSL